MKIKLKKIIQKLSGNQIFAASLIMVVGMHLYNVGQFIYHFLSGRMLGKALYGDLATMITILGFFAIVQMAVGLTIVKFITSIKGKKEKYNFIKWIFLISLLIGLFIGGIFIISSPIISYFLNITDPKAFLLFGPVLFFYLFAASERSILQGLLYFDRYIISFLSESIVKIALTVIFIALGFAVFGAVGAMLIGTVVSFLVAYIYLRNYLKGKRGNAPDFASLLKYSSATLIQGLALTAMYSMDLVLVKHFFSPSEAGIYASTSVLGRIIFFGASPASQAMFPIIAKKYHDNQNYRKIFYLNLIWVSIFCAILTSIYFFIPSLPIGILFGKEYLEGGSLLGWYGLFATLLSLAMLTAQFFLSIGKLKVVYIFLGVALLQIVLILNFHQLLLDVIRVSIIAVSLLNFILFVYFLLTKNEKDAISSGPGIQTRKDYSKGS